MFGLVGISQHGSLAVVKHSTDPKAFLSYHWLQELKSGYTYSAETREEHIKIGHLSAVPKSEKNLQVPLFFHFHICT